MIMLAPSSSRASLLASEILTTSSLSLEEDGARLQRCLASAGNEFVSFNRAQQQVVVAASAKHATSEIFSARGFSAPTLHPARLSFAALFDFDLAVGFYVALSGMAATAASVRQHYIFRLPLIISSNAKNSSKFAPALDALVHAVQLGDPDSEVRRIAAERVAEAGTLRARDARISRAQGSAGYEGAVTLLAREFIPLVEESSADLGGLLKSLLSVTPASLSRLLRYPALHDPLLLAACLGVQANSPEQAVRSSALSRLEEFVEQTVMATFIKSPTYQEAAHE